MSMTGSLMGYENNNHHHHHHQHKKTPIKPLPVVTSVNAAGVTSTTGSSNGGIPRNNHHPKSNNRQSPRRSSSSNTNTSPCGRGHVNSLWSCWYGIIAVGFQAYIAVRCTRRFIAYLSLPWPMDAPPPKLELHACLVLACAGVLLLPILLASACLKLGNLANDGVKLGKHLSTCSRDPPSSILSGNTENGLANNLWRHGGPTSAFVHLCTAMCFLLPSLLMEARLIHAGFLPKEAIWRTDLDWVVTHRERLVALSFMNIPENVTLSLASGQLPIGNYNNIQPFGDDEFDDIANTTSGSVEDLQPTKLSTMLLPSTSSGYYSRRENGGGSDGDYSFSDSSPYTSPSSSQRRPSQRMQARNIQERRRSKSKKNSAIARARSTPAPWVFGNMSALSLPLTFTSLEDLDHPEYLNQEIDETEDSYGPVTLEYLNYAMALGVYSVRYPAVFWASNKALGTIFSFQLVINSVQSLLSYAGMSVLYKVQVVGPLKVLPLLRHRSFTTARTLSSFFGDRFFLLNPHVTLGIFALSSLLVLCSSMVMYLYAYGRFVGFLNQERERKVILPKDGSDDAGWTYMTHPAALCLFLAIAICNAPLLYDYTVVYRGSLDGAVLACVVATVLHLGIWLILWIGLAIKKRWVFKLRVTIGRATVRNARSVKLVTDVDLMNGRDDEDGTAAPLLVVGNGRTYTVAETSPKKAIMSVIQKAAMERKARSQGNGIDSMDGDSTVDGEEQIYWLRPKLQPSPMQSGGNGNAQGDKGWLNKKLKQKVTFNDLPSTSGSRNKGKTRRDGGPEDDGDYATLRELPLVTGHDLADDSTSEENKHWGGWLSPRRDNLPTFTDLLECVNDDQVTYYASGHRDLQPSEGEPSPLLSPEPPPPPPPTSGVVVINEGADGLPLPPPDPTVHVQENVQAINPQMCIEAQTPRCLRRGDSGMPHEELTPRSDSSHSPPLDPNSAHHLNGGASNNSTSSNSETSSSGVHSTSSSQRRATSVEDLTNEPREEPQWRSCSLQRGTAPPTSSSGKYPPSNPGRVITNPTANYANSASYAVYNGCTTESVVAGCPAVILENPNESTVVIRRKNSRPKLPDAAGISEEPFGRSTNMRMTSFTENSDLKGIQASSATLPHYPTQPVVTYPHCSTMPLPHASHNMQAGTSMSSGSCGSVQPRHPVVPEDPEEDLEEDCKREVQPDHKIKLEEGIKMNLKVTPKVSPKASPKETPKKEFKDFVEKESKQTPKQEYKAIPKENPGPVSVKGYKGTSKEEFLGTFKPIAKSPKEISKGTPKEEYKSIPQEEYKTTPKEECKSIPKENSSPISIKDFKETPKEEHKTTPKYTFTPTFIKESKETSKEECKSTPDENSAVSIMESKENPKEECKANSKITSPVSIIESKETPKETSPVSIIESKETPKEDYEAATRDASPVSVEESKGTPKEECKKTPKDTSPVSVKELKGTPQQEFLETCKQKSTPAPKEEPKRTFKGSPSKFPKEESKENPQEEFMRTFKRILKKAPKQESKENLEEESKETPKENPSETPKEESKKNPEEEVIENPKEESKETPIVNISEIPNEEVKENPKEESEDTQKENSSQTPQKESKETSESNSPSKTPTEESKGISKDDSSDTLKDESPNEPDGSIPTSPKDNSNESPNASDGSTLSPKEDSFKTPEEEIKNFPNEDPKEILA